MKFLFILAISLVCAACQSCKKEQPAPIARTCEPDFSPALNADGFAPNDAKITVWKSDAPVVFVHNGDSTVVQIDSMPISFFVRAGDIYRIETTSWADIQYDDCTTI